MTQKIGLNMYTLRDICKTASALRDTFGKVRDVGYKYVQISGLGSVDPHDITDAMNKYDLKACATHLSWDQFLDDLPAVIELHKLYGTTHSAIGGLPDAYRSREGAERFVGEAESVIPRLENAGLDFSYHNHNHEFVKVGDRTWLDTVHDAAAGIGIKFEIDVYWVVAGGADPADYIEKYQQEMSIVHLKDMSVTWEREQRMCPVGSGNLNWSRINDAVKSAPIEFVIVEQDSHYDDDPIQNVAESFNFLKESGFSVG